MTINIYHMNNHIQVPKNYMTCVGDLYKVIKAKSGELELLQGYEIELYGGDPNNNNNVRLKDGHPLYYDSNIHILTKRSSFDTPSNQQQVDSKQNNGNKNGCSRIGVDRTIINSYSSSSSTSSSLSPSSSSSFLSSNRDINGKSSCQSLPYII